MGKRILVRGGSGVLGRRISRAVTAIPSAECIIGGRRPQKDAQFAGANVTCLVVNANEPASLRRALDGVFAVVNAAGPFQGHNYTVAETCAGMGIHYVDIADARAYVEGITRLQRRAQQRDCLIVSGASSVPAVSAALADMLASEFDHISEIHVSFSPGNKNPLGVATVRAILSYTGVSLRVKEQGRWRYAFGWSESKAVRFPKPVGKRRVYLCDVPDLDIFPARYGAQTVTFRAGLELSLFNYGLAILGRMRRRGWIKNLSGWAPGLAATGHLFRAFGSVAGGLQAQIGGRKQGQGIER